MELKKYAKRILKNEPIPNDSRLSYQYYRLFEDRVALVVYDHEKKKRCNSILRKKQKYKTNCIGKIVIQNINGNNQYLIYAINA